VAAQLPSILLLSFPTLPLSFPFFPFASPSLSLEVGTPHIQLTESGGLLLSSPSLSPSQNWIWCISALQDHICWQQFWLFSGKSTDQLQCSLRNKGKRQPKLLVQNVPVQALGPGGCGSQQWVWSPVHGQMQEGTGRGCSLPQTSLYTSPSLFPLVPCEGTVIY